MGVKVAVSGGNLGIRGKSGRFRPGSRVIMTFEWGVN